MRFASMRDMRTKISSFLYGTPQEDTIVVTLRGKPVALFLPIDESCFEEMTRAVNSARLRISVDDLRAQAAKSGSSKLKDRAILTEIRQARKKGKS